MGTDLIISYLDSMAKIFSGVKFVYLINNVEESHFIAVSNQILYDSDEFAEFEYDFREEFRKEFPLDDLTFILTEEIRLFSTLINVHEAYTKPKHWFNYIENSIEFDIEKYIVCKTPCTIEENYSLAA